MFPFARAALAFAIAAAAVVVGVTAQASGFAWSCCCDPNDSSASWAFATEVAPCTTRAYQQMLASNKSFICYGNATSGNNNQVFITAANGTFSVIANGESGACQGDGFSCGNWNIVRSFFPTYDWVIRNNDLTGLRMMTEYLACQVLANEFPDS
jgi:uncharacterized Zn-binding protein involved in type VI secretion